jgi:WD40 repeat protein
VYKRQVLTIHEEGTESRLEPTTLVWEDQDSGESRTILTHGHGCTVAEFDPSGQWIVSAGYNDPVRVGPVSGNEPHLLFGHEGWVTGVEVSPDGRWIASSGSDRTLRLWPMPDLSKPPLHTLPREELVAKLKTLTNLRAVRDEESPTGWNLEIGPFPGWAEVPSW